MTAGSHLTYSNFFWSLSHQSLQHEAMMEQQEPQEKISNPSTKVLVSAAEGGLAITHVHHINATREKS